jgi:hypothetical protein
MMTSAMSPDQNSVVASGRVPMRPEAESVAEAVECPVAHHGRALPCRR